MFSAAMGHYMGAIGKFNALPRTAKWGAIGAGAGGVYGATLGRDPGQSRLGGFMTGAIGGAALGAAAGRYGYAGYSYARPGSQYNTMRTNIGSFRRGAQATMSSDIGRSMDYIGKSGLASNSGFQKIRGLFR